MMETIRNILLVGLVVAPIILLWYNLKVWSIYRADEARPRNRIIATMATNGSIVVAASSGIAVIAFERLLGLQLPEWQTVISIILLFALYSIPVRHYRTVERIAEEDMHARKNGHVETQNQREDREFGEQRRNLEEKHLLDN